MDMHLIWTLNFWTMNPQHFVQIDCFRAIGFDAETPATHPTSGAPNQCR